jgi:hypothetical protein
VCSTLLFYNLQYPVGESGGETIGRHCFVVIENLTEYDMYVSLAISPRCKVAVFAMPSEVSECPDCNGFG